MKDSKKKCNVHTADSMEQCCDFGIAHCAEGIESAVDVGEGCVGVVELCLIELCTGAAVGCYASQHSIHPRNILYELHLRVEQLIGAYVGIARHHLLRHCARRIIHKGDNTVGIRPQSAHIAPCEAIGKPRLREEQHALGTGVHDGQSL